ncbi:hypothetical protein SAICODRAFT_197647 [Saitoella complicata NRRL Y-17804]|uniref:uncharacterized protein n=1 Tax=Saitoella complicata (strain BCRC 22490 / CBS 7301 / JCM 7358 / NBRC 10748 / NRRL Y-17804) TaxID=698492 RepID=UPI000866C519|nr:uncharacterized protein SAICODRAFT_197647 [Saitoella complicata NRRL Y-17804]ODQ54988.1 hypothetical protein SAICODRAFT_197647 [Saitoella complicata NRRL Y-17804]
MKDAAAWFYGYMLSRLLLPHARPWQPTEAIPTSTPAAGIDPWATTVKAVLLQSEAWLRSLPVPRTPTWGARALQICCGCPFLDSPAQTRRLTQPIQSESESESESDTVPRSDRDRDSQAIGHFMRVRLLLYSRFFAVCSATFLSTLCPSCPT